VFTHVNKCLFLCYGNTVTGFVCLCVFLCVYTRAKIVRVFLLAVRQVSGMVMCIGHICRVG